MILFFNTGEDTDGDGFVGKGDNCPKGVNSNQLDTDKDGIKNERGLLLRICLQFQV